MSRTLILAQANPILRGLVKSIDDLEQIQIDSSGIKANTKEGDPLVPLDNLIYPNRHERRKAAAYERSIKRSR